MEIVTVKLKPFEEIRSKTRGHSDAPVAIISDITDDELTLVLADAGELQSMLQNAAAGERQQRVAKRLVEQNRRRRLENRRATSV